MQTKIAFFSVVFVLLVLLFPVYVEAQAIFSDGFESGDFSAWTGTTTSGSGTITVVTERAHHGIYSAKSYKPNSLSSAYVYKTFTAASTIYVRFYLYLSSWTASSGQYDVLFVIRRTGITRFMFMLKEPDRYLYIRYESGGSNYYVQSATTFPLNTWVCIEVEYDKTNGEYRVYMDGAEVSDLTQTGKSITDNADEVSFGFRAFGGAYGTAYFDCVVVADTYIGPEPVEQEISFSFTETIKPSATLIQWQEHIHFFVEKICQTSVHQYGVELILIQTETIQLSDILKILLETGEVFISQINIIKPRETVRYWIEQIKPPKPLWYHDPKAVLTVGLIIFAICFTFYTVINRR